MRKSKNNWVSCTQKKTDLNHRLDDNSIRYGSEMRSGMPLPRMAWHANYADYLQTQIKALLIRIGEAEQQKEIRQTELVSLMKEMSTIERLREEQYRAYLHELANEEEKVLGDLISYDMSIETTD